MRRKGLAVAVLDISRDRRTDWTHASNFDTYANMNIDEAVTAPAALAQDVRLEAFRLLVPKERDGLPAGTIADTLDIPPSTLSFYLNQLANEGLFQSRRQGRSISDAMRVDRVRGPIQ